MIVQVNHVLRLKYGQWLDIRQAGRVGWGSEEWGINNRTFGVDCHFKLEGVGCFYGFLCSFRGKLIGLPKCSRPGSRAIALRYARSRSKPA
jgi:hypothetical protein